MSSRPVRAPGPLKFGEDFELDLDACELQRGGRRLRLERIPCELLLMLLEHSGELVTREQIVGRIWGSGVFLDTDNSINGAVRKIRQVLGDDPEHPHFIETITGRGYRFIAPVLPAKIPPHGEKSVGDLTDLSPDERRGISGRLALTPAARSWRALVAATLLIAASLATYFQWWRKHNQGREAGQRVMIAVLPFQNLTGDDRQDYFSDGLTEEMIAQLGRLDPTHLGVIARTSVMRYKYSQESLGQVGSELGVQYVLEGSVRRDDKKVRVTAQLIQVQDQTHLWAQEYDRELKDFLALQGEIAQQIAEQIELTFGNYKGIVLASHSRLSARGYEEYELYLKGRYFWNKRTLQGFQQAIKCFHEALASDPNDARSYAGLADSYALIDSYNLAPPDEVIPKARAAALKALQIDEGLAEAHTSLALIAENYDWDWQTAEKEYRRAIELDPNYATAHQWYAEFLAFQGRFGEALAESERARRLDPLSLIIAVDHGAILYFSRQYDGAIRQFRSVHDMEPGFTRSHVVIGAYVQKGQFAEALADIADWRRRDGDGPWIWAWQAYVYGRAGEPARAKAALQKLKHMNRKSQLDPLPLLAMAYTGMGNVDQALSCLRQGYLEHSDVITALKVEPIYDPLRADPRFKELLRRARLAR